MWLFIRCKKNGIFFLWKNRHSSRNDVFPHTRIVRDWTDLFGFSFFFRCFYFLYHVSEWSIFFEGVCLAHVELLLDSVPSCTGLVNLAVVFSPHDSWSSLTVFHCRYYRIPCIITFMARIKSITFHLGVILFSLSRSCSVSLALSLSFSESMCVLSKF